MKIPALVYCEIEYIEDFLLKYKEKQKMQDDAPEEYHPFLVFYRFLISSNIVMNISNDEYADKTKDNTLLLKLWKRFSVNGTNNHFEWDGNPKRQTNQEIYLVLNDTCWLN